MAVVCEGQLLLLTQPTDGPVPEPCVLGTVPPAETLIEDDPGQVLSPIHLPDSAL